MQEQDFLLELPSEVTEPIYKFCSTRDLLNLACCNKSLHNSIKYLLWSRVTLPWRYLQKQPISTRQLSNLKHTVNLSFSNVNQFDGGINWKSVATNFENIIQYCDPYKLSAITVYGVINDRGIQLMLKLLETSEDSSNDTYSRQHTYLMPRLFRSFRITSIPRSLICDKDVKSQETLRELHLFHCTSITDFSLKLVGNMTELRHLSISHNHIPSAGFFPIGKLHQLLGLNLESTSINNEFLGHISVFLPQLQMLNISRCNSFDDVGLSYVGKLLNLESLDVSWCTKITDSSFLDMGKALVCLKVQGCSLITDQALITFANGHIHELNIGCTNISDAGLHHLRNNQLLQHLTANGCNHISDDGLGILGGMSSLREVDLSGRTSITDEGLACISSLISLERLKIQNCHQLTDMGLYHISSLKSLIELNISGCMNVTDHGIIYLQNLNMLEQLNMNGCHVTEKGLAHLRNLRSLKLLSIMNMRSSVEPLAPFQAEDQPFDAGHLDDGSYA